MLAKFSDAATSPEGLPTKKQPFYLYYTWDDEGGTEWSIGSVSGRGDGDGDGDVEIVLRKNGMVAVEYRSAAAGC